MKSISYQLAPETAKVIFERGLDYFYDDRVKLVSANKDKFRTVVAGTKPYFVDIKVGPRKIKTKCDCPYNKAREICKHIIASALFLDTQVGRKIPADEEIEKLTIDKPAVSGFQKRRKIDQMFEDPLNADLDFLAIATDFGKWVRPHAKLPKKPRISDTNNPLTEKELLKMFDSLDSWTYRSKYDHYFCAGELVAGFCRGMDIVLKRFELCDDETKLKIFGHCVYFYYQEFLNMFDGSDGIWQIAEARILKMAEGIRELKGEESIKEETWEELRNKLDEAGQGWSVGAKDFL